MGRWSPHRTATAVAVTLLATVASMIPTPSVAGAATWTRDDAFVTAATHDFLGRGPTGAELTAATSSSLRTTAARARVVAGLSNSTEWISVTVQGFYQDTLGRPADADGREYWVGLIKSGKLSVASVAASFYAFIRVLRAPGRRHAGLLGVRSVHEAPRTQRGQRRRKLLGGPDRWRRP